MRPYLALTAHWIANEGGSLKLKVSLIAFHYFPGSHTGEALVKLLLELLDRAEVTMKVRDLCGICCISALINVDQIGHLTMDNALNNIAAMRELAKLLEARDIQFDAVDCRIPCFPHIINICVTHTMKEYINADFSAVAATWVGALGDTVNKGEYLEALAMDPVSLGRNIVCIIRASSQRCKGFRDTIINGNANE